MVLLTLQKMVRFIYQLIYFVVLCYNFQLIVQDCRLTHYKKGHAKKCCQCLFISKHNLGDDDMI